jgi:hypothetical protein
VSSRSSSQVKHAEDCGCHECKRRRNEPSTQTCSACRKRRLCKQVVAYSEHVPGPKTYDPYYCVAECLALSPAERRMKRDEARATHKVKSPPLAWPIIGGPLDGKFAVPADFYSGRWRADGDGQYAEHKDYETFNAANGGNRRIGGKPTMIFVHASLLPRMIRGADR